MCVRWAQYFGRFRAGGPAPPSTGGQPPLEAAVTVELSDLASALLRLPRPAWRPSTACAAGEAWTPSVGLPVEVTESNRAISPHSVDWGLC